MNDHFFESIVRNAPMAYAYHKIVLDEAGVPCDYYFLDVNTAYETMSGLKREEIIGKRVTEVMPAIGEESLDWIRVFGTAALQGRSKEFESFSVTFGRWLRVYVYSPEKYYLIANITDISIKRSQVVEGGQLRKLLKEKDSEFHFIIENLPFSLGALRLDGTFLYMNQAGRSLYEFGEAAYSRKSIIKSFVDPEDWYRFVDKVHTSGVTSEFYMNLRTESGRVFWAISIGMIIKYHGKSSILLS